MTDGRTAHSPDGAATMSAGGAEIRPERGEKTSRRRALKWVIRAGYGAFALAFVPPALALRSLTQKIEGVIRGDLLVHASGELAGSPVNANQLQPGTSTQAFPEGKGESSNNLIQVVRLPDPGGVVAYSAICTHLGCSVLPNLSADGWIICPCHASILDPANNAAVLNGPAGRPLPALPVEIGGDGTITASAGFSGDVGPD